MPTFSVPSGYPKDVGAKNLSSHSFVLEWSPPLEEERNGIIIGYELILEWDMVQKQSRRQNTTHNSHSFTELDQNTTYRFSVAAYTVKGIGPRINGTVTTLPGMV